MDRCQCLISCIPTNHGLSLLEEVPLPIIALLSPTAFSVFGKSDTPLCKMVQSEPPLLVMATRYFTAMVITQWKDNGCSGTKLYGQHPVAILLIPLALLFVLQRYSA